MNKFNYKNIGSKQCILLIIISFWYISLQGQVINDECQFATFIPDVEDFCSNPLEFNNVDATASPQANPSCWPQGTNTNDVWYSFIPKNLGALIQLTGLTISEEGTLVEPSIAIYSGNCGSLVEEVCGSVLFNENVIELTMTDLIIGRTYYIRIDGRNNNQGSFKLCINTFSPIKAPESDCSSGVVLCSKDEFFVEKIEGTGNGGNEVAGTCIQEELASVWYKWTCKDAGTLTFTITPNNKPDDIDFAVYELPNGLDGCGSKRPIRCMASGETIGNSASFNSPCFGATGLSLTDTDLQEDPGCQAGDNNFVRYIDMEAGVSYALIINNFSQSGSGFNIQWGGTGTFLGPEAEFEIEAEDEFECDKRINFVNKSSSETDSIINFVWNFGEDASPDILQNIDSTQVLYSSFGDKTAAIVVESSRGCIVTKVVDFYIKPCCKDTTNLDVSALATAIICPGDTNAIITAQGTAGNPDYKYSIDDGAFQPNPRFFNLASGTYEVKIIDEKGCTDSIIIVIPEPDPLTANAGPDQEVELGNTTILDGNYFSVRMPITYKWITGQFIDTTDMFSLDPEIFPTTTQTYVLQVTDEFGCTDTDEVTIRVKIVRPVYYPNAISPEVSKGVNDFFNLFGGPAVESIQELLVYDRWGNLMYRGENLEHNSRTVGWDGKFNGTPVIPGVYAWAAKVLFIDGEVLDYSGDVTVMK